MLVALVALQVVSLTVRGAQLGPDATVLVTICALVSIAAGGAVAYLPARTLDGIRSFARAVEQSTPRTTAFLSVASLVVLTANVFLQQPQAWDEHGILGAVPHLTSGPFLDGLARAYRENAWLGPQHPPGAPIVYAMMSSLGAEGLYSLRMVSVGFGWAGILTVWRILERLYDRRVGILGALLLLTSPLYVRIGSAIGNDPALLLFFWLALLCGLRLLDAPDRPRAFTLGLVLVAGVLAKYTFVLVAPILAALPWAMRQPWPRKGLLASALVVPAGAVALGLIVLYTTGLFGEQMDALRDLSGRATLYGDWAATSIVARLPAAIGIYALPVILRGTWTLAPFERRTDGLLLVWGLAVFLPIAVTLPVNRFFMPAFPAVSAVMALGLLRATRPVDQIRIPLVMAALCATTLAYYGWVDLSVRLRLFDLE